MVVDKYLFLGINMSEKKQQKVKTTLLIDKTLRKLAKVHAIQNDMSFGELVERALEEKIVNK